MSEASTYKRHLVEQGVIGARLLVRRVRAPGFRAYLQDRFGPLDD